MKTASIFILLTIFTLMGVSSVFAKTDIKITTNGETKEFHSDGTKDIDYTSDDGKTRVSVKNNTTTTKSTSQKTQESTMVTVTKTQPTSITQPTPTENEENIEEEEIEDSHVSDNRPFPSSVIERFKSILNGIASRMFNLFSSTK